MELLLVFFSSCILWLLYEGVVLIVLYYKPYILFSATESKKFFHPSKGEYSLYRQIPYRYYYHDNIWKRKTIRLFVEKSSWNKKVVLKRKSVWEIVPFEQSKHFKALIKDQKTPQ